MLEQEAMDKQMRLMLRQVLSYLLFLFMIVYVCITNQDPNAFLQNQDIKNTFTNGINVSV